MPRTKLKRFIVIIRTETDDFTVFDTRATSAYKVYNKLNVEGLNVWVLTIKEANKLIAYINAEITGDL